ncbi:MAG: hypothetical protein DMF68_09180 [Acidobacteria bacterium]|nr:MAG: hypothetical protein DMF68_09180 [Acidobacteriota bacterium]
MKTPSSRKSGLATWSAPEWLRKTARLEGHKAFTLSWCRQFQEQSGSAPGLCVDEFSMKGDTLARPM